MADRTLELLIRLAGENASLKAAITGSQRDLSNLGKAGQSAGAAIGGGLDGAAASMRRLVVQAGAGYLSFQGLRTLFSEFTRVAGDFERARVQLNSLFGDAEKGADAFAWVKQFAKDTPFELQDVLTAFQTLKNFGLDPMGGAMQAVADQASLFGGTQVQLQGISLALGQAWARQKLQGQDILQLINQGVPVWELLSKVTGENVAELNRMSEAGELGQDVIRKLIEAMGEAAGGAAQAQMKTFTGQVSNLKDTWSQFLDEVAQSGALDEMKSALDEILNTTGDMAGNGDMASFAEQVGNGIGSVVGLARDAASAVASLSGELKILAELWVAGKILAYTDGLRQMMAASTAARQEALALATTQRGAADAAAVAASAAARQAEAAMLFRQMRVAEAQAAVQAASGMNKLATAQNQLLPAQAALRDATAAHNVALENQVKATRASSAALKAQGAAATAAGAGFVTLSGIVGAFSSILTSIPIMLAVQQVGRLLAVIAEHREAVRGMEDAYKDFERVQRKAIAENEKFADVQALTASEVKALTAEEQDAYAKRLRAAEAYWKAVFELEARRPDGDRELTERANREVRAYSKALADLKPVLDARAQAEKDSADRIAALKKDETDRIIDELDRQKKAYDDANKAIEDAQKERASIERQFADIQQAIKSGPPRKIETSLDVTRETASLRQRTGAAITGLERGGSTADAAAEAERIIEQATKAAEAVQALVEGGTISRGVGSRQAAELEAIALAANKIRETAAQINMDAAKAAIDSLTTSAKALENLKISFDDAQAITDAQALRAALEAELAANPIVVKVVLDRSGGGEQIINDAEVTVPGKAGGGLIPGSSPTPTADNILIRATAGEYMQPVAAVRRYGLDAMEALRSGRVAPERIQRAIRGYAQGGLISPALTSLPAVPSAAAVAPAAPASAPAGQQMGVLVLQADGRSYRATMPAADADDLLRTIHHEALKTGARKPR